MKGDPQSALDSTGLELGPAVSAGALGNAYQRKNRGRMQEILSSNPNWTRLADVIGDDQLAAGMTVTCDLQPAQGLDAEDRTTIPAVVGRVSWGTDGAAHDVEFDFTHGTVLHIAGSSIRVDARVESDPSEIGRVQARVSLSYLPKPGLPAQRTLRSAAPLLFATGAEYAIPRFARSVEVLRVPNPLALPPLGQAINVLYLDASGTPIARESAVGPIRMAIPQGACKIAVVNASAEPQTHALVFSLWI